MSGERRMLPCRATTLGLFLAVAVPLGGLAGCGSDHQATLSAQPATVESIAGPPLHRVRLTADAARRIDLHTATMKQQAVPGRPQLAALGAGTTTTAAPPATPTPATATPATSAPRAPGDTEPPKNGVTPPSAPPAAPVAPPPTPAPATTTTTVPRLTVPTSAVLYQPTGEAFVYVVAGPLTYERRPVVVDYVVGNLAVLTSGPPDGTPIVTVGGAELLGAELGVGGQELG